MIEPGGTIGILGGGQLGRMTGMAARALGYDVRVLDPDPRCSAAAVASAVIVADFDDADAAATLARQADVVTLEIEQISGVALEAAAAHAPLRPGVDVVRIIQDRITQRGWLAGNGFPVGAHRAVASRDDCVAAVAALGPSILKAPRGGYDGRGQVRVARAEEAAAAWDALGARPCLVEQFLDIGSEISVLVARPPGARARPGGRAEAVVFPPAHNFHERGVLDWSMIPASLAAPVRRDAEELALAIAETIAVEGLLAVEMFLLHDGRLLVNELAPRPHNTFHSTERTCVTSQFEQLVRAVCALPLGAPALVTSGAIANLLGDLWSTGAPRFAAALAVPTVRLHLYGKADARPGRKMGHLSAVGDTPEAALRRVLDARAAMRP